MKITNLKSKIEELVIYEINKFYQNTNATLEVQYTKEDFEGDFTIVVFPLSGILRKKPEEVGMEIGDMLTRNLVEIEKYNVVKGFLNLSINPILFADILEKNAFVLPDEKEKVIVEYSSPNTNKPLHLGHVRNNLLGYSVAKILEASGKSVKKIQLINDRGIHICKSMVAYQKYGNNETPDSAKTKGDHFVGEFYIKFDQVHKKEVEALINNGLTEKEAKKMSPILLEAKKMLQDWEAGDKEVLQLWKSMNSWVYKGFEETYTRMGVEFDENQYESYTYLLGKNIIEEGLENGIFIKKEDNSIWVDLSNEGLEEKLLLRGDGTSVYITQDIGTAKERIDNQNPNQIIYTVGNEQDYHFKVLFSILEKLKLTKQTTLHHLSYGMVNLPDGKMKSREGNVVDADDLMKKMQETAKEIAEVRGEIEEMSTNERTSLYESIGMGALKYHLLKVNPKKTILFDPKQSVDFQGNTGPFIQYTFARIQSLLSKDNSKSNEYTNYTNEEKKILLGLDEYPIVLNKSSEELDPSIICNYVYDLVKKYNVFYQKTPILKSNSIEKEFRLLLSKKVSDKISECLLLLGIHVVNKM